MLRAFKQGLLLPLRLASAANAMEMQAKRASWRLGLFASRDTEDRQRLIFVDLEQPPLLRALWRGRDAAVVEQSDTAGEGAQDA